MENYDGRNQNHPPIRTGFRHHQHFNSGIGDGDVHHNDHPNDLPNTNTKELLTSHYGVKNLRVSAASSDTKIINRDNRKPNIEDFLSWYYNNDPKYQQSDNHHNRIGRDTGNGSNNENNSNHNHYDDDTDNLWEISIFGLVGIVGLLIAVFLNLVTVVRTTKSKRKSSSKQGAILYSYSSSSPPPSMRNKSSFLYPPKKKYHKSDASLQEFVHNDHHHPKDMDDHKLILRKNVNNAKKKKNDDEWSEDDETFDYYNAKMNSSGKNEDYDDVKNNKGSGKNEFVYPYHNQQGYMLYPTHSNSAASAITGSSLSNHPRQRKNTATSASAFSHNVETCVPNATAPTGAAANSTSLPSEIPTTMTIDFPNYSTLSTTKTPTPEIDHTGVGLGLDGFIARTPGLGESEINVNTLRTKTPEQNVRKNSSLYSIDDRVTSETVQTLSPIKTNLHDERSFYSPIRENQQASPLSMSPSSTSFIEEDMVTPRITHVSKPKFTISKVDPNSSLYPNIQRQIDPKQVQHHRDQYQQHSSYSSFKVLSSLSSSSSALSPSKSSLPTTPMIPLPVQRNPSTFSKNESTHIETSKNLHGTCQIMEEADRNNTNELGEKIKDPLMLTPRNSRMKAKENISHTNLHGNENFSNHDLIFRQTPPQNPSRKIYEPQSHSYSEEHNFSSNNNNNNHLSTTYNRNDSVTKHDVISVKTDNDNKIDNENYPDNFPDLPDLDHGLDQNDYISTESISCDVTRTYSVEYSTTKGDDVSSTHGQKNFTHALPPRSMSIEELRLSCMETGSMICDNNYGYNNCNNTKSTYVDTKQEKIISTDTPIENPVTDEPQRNIDDCTGITLKNQQEECTPSQMSCFITKNIVGVNDIRKSNSFSDPSSLASKSDNSLSVEGVGTEGANGIIHKRRDLSSWSDATSSLTYPIDFKELKLKSVIGGGGFGQVWEAMWRGTPVAVKVLSVSAQTDHVQQAILQEFAAEINLLSGMRHPNICLYIGACLDPPNRAIVTELAANGALWDSLRLDLKPPYSSADGRSRDTWPLSLYIAKDVSKSSLIPPYPPKGAWPWVLVKRVASGAARGMNYLHSGKPAVLHRDLKSANILLDDSYNAKVADFGLSRIKAQERSMTGNCGTVQWMAPEILASESYAEPSDVYSYGIILWELLSRECPYNDLSPIQVALSVLNHDNRPKVPKWCPQAFSELINRCLLRDPDARPTFAEVLSTLDTMI